MIRLAVDGIDEVTCGQLAARLRGVALVTAAERNPHRSSVDCDAVAMLGSPPVSPEVADWLNAGKHILLTADACDSIEVLEKFAASTRQSGVQLMIANSDHFLPSRQLIREQLDAGKLGEVGLVRSHRWLPATTNQPPDRHGLPMALARDLALTTSLIGRAPNLVFGTSLTTSGAKPAAGRFIQVHLGFARGAMALVDYCDRLPSGSGYQTLSVIAASGAAYIDDQQNTQLLYAGGQAQAVGAEEGVRPLANIVQSFVDGLATGRDFSISVNAWRGALKIVDAVRQSLESGESIAIEESP